jgi:hypothetical protein
MSTLALLPRSTHSHIDATASLKALICSSGCCSKRAGGR